MLPSFRVRDLRRPRSPGSGRLLMAGPQKSIYDATVRISALEYDTTLSDHPEATLKYVDEDDGDIIAVGSSLELTQRLGEPVVSSKLKPHRRTNVEPIRTAGSEHSVNSSLHTFDIYCQGNSLKAWQEIDKRSKQLDVANVTLEELRGLEGGKLLGLDMQQSHPLPASRPLPELERPAMPQFVRTEDGGSATQSQSCGQSSGFVPDLERSTFTTMPFKCTNYAESATQSQSCKQPSLLQVFEAELAGLSRNQNELYDTEQASAGRPSSASTYSRDVLELSGSSGGCESVKKPGNRDPRPFKPFINRLIPTSSAPPKDGSAITSPRLQPTKTLEIGLRTALNSFGTCVHNIANVVQNTSTTSHAVAESTKAVESQLLNDAVQGLRGAAEAIAALGQSFIEHNSANVAKAVAQGVSQTASSPTWEKSQPYFVVLWPMPDIAALVGNVKIASDIEDILRLNIKDTVKILISPEKDWGARMVFIKVESEEVAMRVCRHMSCRPYHGRRLNAAIVSAPASGDSDAAILRTKLTDILPSRIYPFPRDNANKASKMTKAEAKDTAVPSKGNSELNTTHESQGNVGNGNPDRLNIPKEHSSAPLESLSVSLSCGPESMMSEHKNLSNESPSRSSPITQSLWESFPLDHRRSRSSFRENSDWDLPKRRASPYGLRFHKPGPIHLPQDEIEVSKTDCAHPLSSDIHDYQETFCPYSKEWSARFSKRAARDNCALDRPGASHMTENVGSGSTKFCDIPKSASSLSRLPQAQHHAQGPPRMSPYINLTAPGTFTKTRTSRGSFGIDTYFRRNPINEPILKPSNTFIPLQDDVRHHGLPVFAPISDTGYQATCGRQTGPCPSHYGGLPSPNGPEKQKCNGGTEQNLLVVAPSGAIHSSPSIEAPIQSTNSTPTASRFPTLEQFEGRSFAGLSNPPPLPSIEPLIQQRPCEEWKPRKVDEIAFPLVQAVESVASNNCPPSLGQRPTSSDIKESSGDFFYRMTGLTEEAAKLLELQSTSLRREGLFVPSPELARPSMSLTETLTQRPRDLFDGVQNHVVEGIKRHATVVGSTNSYVANSRRPYSENFSGNGRLPWESCLENDMSGLKGGSSCQDLSGINSHHSTSVFDNMGKATAPSAVEAVAVISVEMFPGEHNDSSTVAKVQDCVEKLKDLGFGGNSDGGVKRLVVYAQAAEGNLSDAIDMIDEEQRAYHEWSY